MKTITLNCTQCGEPFERNVHQYKYCNIKKNMKPFCGRRCQTIYRNKHMAPESWKKLFDIKSRAGNRKDTFSSFKYFITKCKERKKHKGYEYNIDLQYLKELWNNQKGTCPYTGFKMVLPETTKSRSQTHSLKKASLDRIDSTKGYIKGNVEFVCLLINMAKNNATKEEVLRFIEELKIGSPAGI